MKKIKYLILSVLAVCTVMSCQIDNYDAPGETLSGSIIDKATKEPFQTAAGGTGVKITLMEYSWSENPIPYNFYAKMDGTFNNTKLFAGEYGITPHGAFVPVEEQKIKIKGKTTVNYEVEPFLRIEWVGEPKVNADGTIDTQFKITRGTSNPDYQQDVTDVWLYVCENTFVGDFGFNPNLSSHFAGNQIQVELGKGSEIFGKTLSVRTGQPNGSGEGKPQNYTPEFSRKYYLRAAARINKDVEGAKIYNYSTIKEITTIAR